MDVGDNIFRNWFVTPWRVLAYNIDNWFWTLGKTLWIFRRQYQKRNLECDKEDVVSRTSNAYYGRFIIWRRCGERGDVFSQSQPKGLWVLGGQSYLICRKWWMKMLKGKIYTIYRSLQCKVTYNQIIHSVIKDCASFRRENAKICAVIYDAVYSIVICVSSP